MWLGIFYNFSFRSDKEINLILEDLESIIKINSKSTIVRSHENLDKPFSGTLTNKGFAIYSNYLMKNSFRPFIKGNFKLLENDKKPEIEICFYINKIVLILLPFILFAIGNILITILAFVLIVLIFNIEVYFTKKILIRFLTLFKE